MNPEHKSHYRNDELLIKKLVLCLVCCNFTNLINFFYTFWIDATLVKYTVGLC